MNKLEYKLIYADGSDVEDKLNSFASEGWILQSSTTTIDEGYGTYEFILILKREVSL